MLELSLLEVFLAGIVFPFGFAFWSVFFGYGLYKLISKSITYRFRSWAAEKVLG